MKLMAKALVKLGSEDLRATIDVSNPHDLPDLSFPNPQARPSGRVCLAGERILIDMTDHDWQGAYSASMEVLKKDPSHVGALETLAQAQWHRGDFDEVVKTTTRLLQLNPYEPGYRFTRGMARMTQGRLDLAAEDFRQAIAQSEDPGFVDQVKNSLVALEHMRDRLVPISPADSADRANRRYH